MDLKHIQRRKLVLIIVIVVTASMPLFFVRFNEPTRTLQIVKFLAKLGSLCGTVLLIWQFLLGFRAIAGKFLQDLIWVLNVHKAIGKYILFLIVMHPIFITVYYISRKNFNPLMLQGGWPFSGYALLGELAFALLILIVVTSIFFRSRLSFSVWYGFHLTSYIALPLLFVHSLPIGMTLKGTALYNVWIALAVLVAALFVFRLFFRLEFFSSRYQVSSVENIGPSIVKITAAPVSNRIIPKLGQFIYFRKGLRASARPFTVSHYYPQSGELAITVKAFGKTTTSLQSTKPGETVYIDGPYGVFSRAALESDRPLVMIAGGIGITPFVRLFEELAHQPDRELHLFYGSKRTREIVYKQELESVEHINIIHVLSDDPDYSGETGFITINLLKRYLTQPLDRYEFLICGPPVMIVKLEKSLAGQNVPNTRIHHELFTY